MDHHTKAVGIISEYNPFHAGHAYHIREAKRLTGARYAVVVMNGDFVQRGEPAIFDKYTRTRQALEGGADLVFELPVRYGISSAGDFAMGAVSALDALGFVSSICFGSEVGELAPILEVADALAEESDAFRQVLDKSLRQGMSYPVARAKALTATTDLDPSLLDKPNNILGIEYCLALKKTSSSIHPYTIPRIGRSYHDKVSHTEDEYPSSTALREQIKKSDTPHMTLEDMSDAIGYALLASPDLTRYKDISPDLADRIHRYLPDYSSATKLIHQCQNPSLATTRIQRCLIQCLIGITYSDMSVPYLRLLGMRKEVSSLLSHIEDTSCNILSKLAADVPKLDAKATSLWERDRFASDIYRQIWCRKYRKGLPNEYQHSPIVL